MGTFFRRFCIFSLILLVGCSGSQAPKEKFQSDGLPILRGVTLSPKSFSSEDFSIFLTYAQEAGTALAWSGDWAELAIEKEDGPEVTMGLSKKYGLTPVIIAQFFTQSSGTLLRPLTDESKKRYLEDAIAFARKYQPPYLALGIEINTLYEKDPPAFEAFVQFFPMAYDSVKAASPSTKVFTVFQLERMKGLHGGLFGGTNDESKAEWFLLEKFMNADIIGFTTYPGLIYRYPSEIPSDYYSEIAKHAKKPVVFTEIGWHSAAKPKGWESSEEEQALFVQFFFNHIDDLRPLFAIWSFLYDQKIQEPFDSAGLIQNDGGGKEAWNAWKKSYPP